MCRPPSLSETKDGRQGLFGTLQGTDSGPPSLDSWMGHPLVNPTKGKLGLAAPTDRTGAAFQPTPVQECSHVQTAETAAMVPAASILFLLH